MENMAKSMTKMWWRHLDGWKMECGDLLYLHDKKKQRGKLFRKRRQGKALINLELVSLKFQSAAAEDACF